MLKEIKPKGRTNHREDPRGCLLNLLLQNQSPSLKRPLQRRERRYPKGKREKLMLARRGITLQKMEMPKQTRHRKQKVLERPSEVCGFLITVYLCIDLTPLSPDTCWDLTPSHCLPVCQAIWTFQ
uniref:Uncharacterized protein n=1 Tax=Piliocolobus tephrosceles TaxID=591936 RepID=A0A8C9LHC9_9PRIM